MSQSKPKRDAYVWMRQFSFEQVQKLSRIETARRWLDADTLALSRFARCQLQETDLRCDVLHSFDGVWEGHEARFEPNLRPLWIDYAIKVYAHVLREAYAYYPSFAKHYFADGPLVGERRIIFPDGLDQAAAYWLQSRFYRGSDWKSGERCHRRFARSGIHRPRDVEEGKSCGLQG